MNEVVQFQHNIEAEIGMKLLFFNHINRTELFSSNWSTMITEYNCLTTSGQIKTYSMLLRAFSWSLLSTDKHWGITYQGSLFQCLIILVAKKCIPMPIWRPPSCHWCQGAEPDTSLCFPSSESCREQWSPLSASFSSGWVSQRSQSLLIGYAHQVCSHQWTFSVPYVKKFVTTLYAESTHINCNVNENGPGGRPSRDWQNVLVV